jgi:hypothetical protein
MKPTPVRSYNVNNFLTVPNNDRPASSKILVCINMFGKLPDSDATIHAVIIDVNHVMF